MKELIYDFLGYNESIFYSINNAFSSPLMQHILKYVTLIFDIEMFAIYYCIILGILLCRIYSLKQYTQYSFCYDFMVKLGICYACFGLTYAALKFSINMPRPFCSLPNSSFTTILDLSNERCLSSFPSSHTGLAFLIVIFLWNYINTISRLFLLSIVAIVALSRIGLAMHYPADILYSLPVAGGVYILGMWIYRKLEHNFIAWIKGKIWELTV